MITRSSRRRPTCPACSGPTRTPALCEECFDAFALARRAHPSAAGSSTTAGEDLDVWDTWSFLGDVGDRAIRCVTT